MFFVLIHKSESLRCQHTVRTIMTLQTDSSEAVTREAEEERGGFGPLRIISILIALVFAFSLLALAWQAATAPPPAVW